MILRRAGMLSAAIREYPADDPESERPLDCLRLSLKRRILLVGPAGLRAEELE